MRLVHASDIRIEGLYCPLPPVVAVDPTPYPDVLAWMERFDLGEEGDQREAYAEAGAYFAVDNFPLADALGQRLLARLFVLGFYFDDVYCEPLSRGEPKPRQAWELFERLADCLIDTASRPGTHPAITAPVTLATADFVRDLQRHYSSIVLKAFAGGWRTWIGGLRWEVALDRRAPSLAEFFTGRFDNFGAEVLTVVGGAGSGLGLDEPPGRAPYTRALIQAGWALVIIYNEWASYAKEQRAGTGSSNLVEITAAELGAGTREAVIETVRLHDRIMEVFLRLAEMCRAEGGRSAGWVDFMNATVAGHLTFCTRTNRYGWPPDRELIVVDRPCVTSGTTPLPEPLHWWWREAGLPLGDGSDHVRRGSER